MTNITKNPYVNALLAVAYICLIVTVMNLTSGFVMIQQTLFLPMAMLSLFVFSAAVMGFLFVFEPFTLYFEGKRPEAIIFFLKTLGTFGVCAVVMFGVVLAISF